jgi:hypothetical protein
MELDDLKQNWNEQSKRELKNLNNNFMEMIHNKNYGPLAVLKEKIISQLIIFLAAIGIMIFIFFKKPELWYLIDFLVYCLFVLANFYWMNYKLIGRLQNIDATVKETIEKNIKLLEKNIKKYFRLSRFYFILTVIVIEILMLINDKNLASWHNYSIFIRITIYFSLFILIYFIGKYVYKNQYEKHIVYLKELLEKIK